VNWVAPGFIDTEMVTVVPKDALEWVIANIPVGRLGRPEEIAQRHSIPLHDDAVYVTGSVISVNGGMEM
jgi:acetoacetyl-CoA reductase